MTGHLHADDHPKGGRAPGDFAPWHQFDACFRNLFWLLCLLCFVVHRRRPIIFPRLTFSASAGLTPTPAVTIFQLNKGE